MVSTGDFEKFAQRFYPWFVRDNNNLEVIQLLVWYMSNDSRFEEKKYCLGKGICLVGNPGTGKTILLEIMQKYFIYKNDPMQFKSIGVPAMSKNFTKDGYTVFDAYVNNNCFFDELGNAQMERVQHMGNKILMGDVLIHQLEKKFTAAGNIFHFTTNCPIEIPKNGMKFEYPALREIYEGRTVDRIYGMCNIIFLVGPSRRKTSAPERRLRNQDNQITIVPAEHIVKKDIIECMITDFEKWISSGKNNTSIRTPVLYYDLLDKMQILKFDKNDKIRFIEDAKQERVSSLKAGNFDGNLFGINALINQYKEGAQMEDSEYIKTLAIAKRICLENFFTEMEIKGTGMLTDLLKENAELNAQQESEDITAH